MELMSSTIADPDARFARGNTGPACDPVDRSGSTSDVVKFVDHVLAGNMHTDSSSLSGAFELSE